MEQIVLLLWALLFIAGGLYSLVLLSMPFFIIGIYFKLMDMLAELKRKELPPK
jgi:hypothetical protein